MSDEKTNFRNELTVIPGWAIGLAAVAFIGLQLLMHAFGFRRDPHPPTVPVQLCLGLVMGTVVACVIMLIGYVNGDAKRRGMRSGLWTAIVIFVHYAIGFILYFALRQPMSSACPQCGVTVKAGFNFCPNCKYNLRPACPECKREVHPGDRYCPYCAHDLSGDAPAGGGRLNPVAPGATA